MKSWLASLSVLSVLIFGLATTAAAVEEQPLRAGAAAMELQADDSMVIGGGIGPGKAKGQEGELRASALVIEGPDGGKACLVTCDVLMVARDVLDRAAHEIERRTGIPFDAILINATHTHHAPTTVTIHGYERDEAFTKQLETQIVAAAEAASKRLAPAEFLFCEGIESSVGRNSRLLLSDGTIYWIGRFDDAVRPTGPFDSELPVLTFRRPGDGLEAVLFNHSTHTIGARTPGVRSPGFYGLAAQELENEHGGTFLFFEGASGSTHNLDLKAPEMIHRIKAAVEDALAKAKPRPVDRVAALRSEIEIRYRHFDEAAEDAAVLAYCRKRTTPENAEQIAEVFRAMRAQLAPKQGEVRSTWIQALVIGDVAIVGVPAEFFTVLGREIKRRSPYRYTYVFELANDYIGYVPDDHAYDLGGYQVWTGLHSFVERGTGERLVEEAVHALQQLHNPSPQPSEAQP